MGNACKGNLLRLQSCFLVVESFSMFHVKRWLFFVVGGGRVLGFSFSCWGWMFHVEHGSLSRWEKMIQLLNILMHVTISWRFGKASCMACWNQGSLFSRWENMVRLVVGRTLFFVSR